MAKKLKVEQKSIPWLYALAVVPLLIAALAQWGVIDLTTFQADTITIIAALFVASEVGLMGMLRNRRIGKDALRIFGAIVAVVAILAAGTSLFGLSFAFFEGIKGTVNILVILYVVIEAFR